MGDSATGLTVPAHIGRYAVVGQIAAGGMGQILLGKLVGLAGFERAVAIKRIHSHLAVHATFVNMFLDEARIAARIHHPNVVQVHELGREGNDLFIVQEYLEGESLAGVLRRLVARGRRLPCGLAAFIAAEACAGLAAAHELVDDSGEALHVVHRDISPENLFITYGGAVKLLDFGIATARDRISQTQTGQTKGKFAYMSPEQCRGGAIDARSDLFSLGVVVHEAVALEHLFERANQLAAVAAICEQPIPPLSSVAPDSPALLDRICARALERDPADRYLTARAMRNDLVRLIREVGPDDPQAGLAGLMRELFGERIEDKRRMLRALVTDAGSIEMAPSEVDTHVELPARSHVPTRPARPRRRRAVVAGGAVVALAAAAIGLTVHLAGRHRAGEPPTPAEPRASAVAASTPPAAGAEPVVAAAPTPVQVQLEIDSKPGRADVYVDGSHRGQTPLVLQVERSSTVGIELRRRGWQTREESVRADRDRKLSFVLERARPARRDPERPTPKPRSGFHRF